MDWSILVWIIAVGLIILGLVGTVVPVLPGVPVAFAGMLLAAWITDFQPVGWITIAVLGVLTVLAVLVDFLASAFGAKRLGASGRAFWGATLGALVGMFFGLIGIVIGPFIGAVAAELSAGSGARQAGRSGYGAWLGMIVGTAAKLAIVFLMIGIFVSAYLIAWF